MNTSMFCLDEHFIGLNDDYNALDPRGNTSIRKEMEHNNVSFSDALAPYGSDPRIISRPQSNIGISRHSNQAVESPDRDDQFLRHDVLSRSQSRTGTSLQTNQAMDSPIRDYQSLRYDVPSRPQSSMGMSHQRSRAVDSPSWDHRSLQYQVPTEWHTGENNSIASSRSENQCQRTNTHSADGTVAQSNLRRHSSQHKRSHPYARKYQQFRASLMAEGIGEEYTQPHPESPISISDQRTASALSTRQDAITTTTTTITRYSTTPERTPCTQQDTASTYPTPPHQTTPNNFDSCDRQEDLQFHSAQPRQTPSTLDNCDGQEYLYFHNTRPHPTPSTSASSSDRPEELYYHSAQETNTQPHQPPIPHPCTCLSSTINTLEALYQTRAEQSFSNPSKAADILLIIHSSLNTCEQITRCASSCFAPLRCLLILQELFGVIQCLQQTRQDVYLRKEMGRVGVILGALETMMLPGDEERGDRGLDLRAVVGDLKGQLMEVLGFEEGYVG